MGLHDETDRMVAAGDLEALSAVVHEAIDAFNESAEPSSDAFVAFDEEKGMYAVQKEVYGKQIEPMPSWSLRRTPWRRCRIRSH